MGHSEGWCERGENGGGTSRDGKEVCGTRGLERKFESIKGLVSKLRGVVREQEGLTGLAV